MKSEPKNTPVDVRDVEQALGQRRLRAAASRSRHVERAVVQHGPAGQELQGRRIGRRFGLDEHVVLRLARVQGRRGQMDYGDQWNSFPE